MAQVEFSKLKGIRSRVKAFNQKTQKNQIKGKLQQQTLKVLF